MRLERFDIHLAFSVLELLATLVCVLVFEPAQGARLTENQNNGFTLDKMASTKCPLYLVLIMELAEQLPKRKMLLSVAWRLWDEIEEADALTNDNFGAFDPRSEWTCSGGT